MADAMLMRQEANHWWEVTIHRPQALNALNADVLDELAALAKELKERADLHGLILTGSGEKAFVAGADIAGLVDLDPPAATAFALRGQAVMNAIERCGKPVIAAVNGWALGGGCELALACHIRVLSKTAKMGLPEVSLGVIPGYGGTQRLARIVGAGRALEMIASGDPIGAEDAHRIGLANQIVEPAELMDACRKLAAKISTRGPRAVSLAIEAVLAGRDLPMDAALEIEANRFGDAAATEDWREGTRAFLEKRKPEFKGK